MCTHDYHCMIEKPKGSPQTHYCWTILQFFPTSKRNKSNCIQLTPGKENFINKPSIPEYWNWVNFIPFWIHSSTNINKNSNLLLLNETGPVLQEHSTALGGYLPELQKGTGCRYLPQHPPQPSLGNLPDFQLRPHSMSLSSTPTLIYLRSSSPFLAHPKRSIRWTTNKGRYPITSSHIVLHHVLLVQELPIVMEIHLSWWWLNFVLKLANCCCGLLVPICICSLCGVRGITQKHTDRNKHVGPKILHTMPEPYLGHCSEIHLERSSSKGKKEP